MGDHPDSRRATLEAAYRRLYSRVVLAAAESEEPAMKAVALHTLEEIRDHLQDPGFMAADNAFEPFEQILRCPVCRCGVMTLATRLDTADVCRCVNCEVTMTVPRSAWKKLPQP